MGNVYDGHPPPLRLVFKVLLGIFVYNMPSTYVPIPNSIVYNSLIIYYVYGGSYGGDLLHIEHYARDQHNNNYILH